MKFLVKNQVIEYDQKIWEWNLKIFGRRKAINEVKKDIVLQFRLHEKEKIKFSDIKIISQTINN